MHHLMHCRPQLDMTFRHLPELFFKESKPSSVSQPTMLLTNQSLANDIGIDTRWLISDDANQVLSGNQPLAQTASIANAYAGHQFGHLNPHLGDGRAHLLGEITTPNQQRLDIQLKGSGTTPYSRQGDGRSPLGPVLREYMVSEAMHALGVPTTRSLAAIATGDKVVRDAMHEQGGILTRVAQSHIRVGSFTFAAMHGAENTQALADYCLARHFPHLPNSQLPYLQLLEAVIERQAQLIAQWMSLGFIHGVMNTDNMLICGQTVDYGPCAFLDNYEPNKTFSFIDRQGRYRYNNQPAIGQWNLVRFAEALLPIMGDSTDAALPIVQDVLNNYPRLYEQAFDQLMAKKIGLNRVNEKSRQLVNELLAIMAQEALDFTLTFRYLMTTLTAKSASKNQIAHNPFEQLINAQLFDTASHPKAKQAIDTWAQNWCACIPQTNASLLLMAQNNPVFIPRNHLIQNAIDNAYKGDMQLTQDLLKATSTPYDCNATLAHLAIPPQPGEAISNTFCGT